LVEASDVSDARVLARELGAVRTFDHVPAIAAQITQRQLEYLREHRGVRAVTLDTGGTAHLAEALPLAGFVPVSLSGLTGQGTKIAVIDTGIDRSHPDLAEAVIDEACFCGSGCCPGGLTEAFGPGSAADDGGHGTHVAGIIAGSGQATGQPGGAPATQLIAIKILDAFNAFCCTSDLVAALDWLLTQHPDVDLVNMSLGANGLYAGDCDEEATVGPVADAARALIESGAVLVASSGNNGMFGMPSPACLSDVISVGAVWDADLGAHGIGCSEESTAPDQIACFSNTSPTLDLLAPGAIVTSTWPVGLTRGRAGTSQAAPIATACGALLRQAQPSASPTEVTLALRTSATWLTDTRNGVDYPRLDCAAALDALNGTGDDGGTGEADAAIMDASAQPMDGSLEAGGSMEIEAGPLPSDAATDGHEASTQFPDAGGAPTDATDASDASDATDASVATDAAAEERDAMGHHDVDAAVTGEQDDAGRRKVEPRATTDCGCRSAGLPLPNTRLQAALSLALALGCLLRVRRRSR
jgi:subtilisin family serine protease